MKLSCLAAAALLLLAGTALAQEGPQLTTPRLREPQQRALFTPLADNFKLTYPAVTGAFRVENAAALTLQQDKGAKPFLSTLPYPGSAQFLTALKPCGIVTPHTHPRATEIYSVMYGNLNAGIAQENGVAQNVSFTVAPGEAVVVPMGLLHAQSNNQCTSVAFFQSFNSADPGSLSVGNALASLGAVSPGLLDATRVQAANTGLGAFALDPQCLQRCNLPSNGGNLNDLPDNIKVMFGLTAAAPSSPSPSPAATQAPAATPATTPAATTQASSTGTASSASAAASSMSSGTAQAPASGGRPCPCSLAPGFDATDLNLRQMLLDSGNCPPDVYPGCPSGSFGFGNSGGCGNVGCFNDGTNNIGNYNDGTSNQGEFNSGTGLIGRNLTGTGSFNVASVPGVGASGR